jgi:hypothetical protein
MFEIVRSETTNSGVAVQMSRGPAVWFVYALDHVNRLMVSGRHSADEATAISCYQRFLVKYS